MSKDERINEENYDGPDKPIAKRVVRVKFLDSKWDYSTSINGTRSDIANFFWGVPLEVSHRNHVTAIATELEFSLDDGKTIVAVLPKRNRGEFLHRGYIIGYDPPPIPIRTSDWQYHVHCYDGPEDGRAGTAATKEQAIELVNELIATIVASKG